MKPKEKAKELYNSIRCPLSATTAKHRIKECALVTVDEILLAIQDSPLADVDWDYWKEVKREIEQL
jgi:hypothetical protein